MLEDLRPMLADAVIRRSVGDDAWRRGAAYAREGRVSEISYARSTGELGALVVGSQRRVYQTVAVFDRADARWWGECSCPVGEDCKHAAAVLVAARQALLATPAAPRAPDWEFALAALVEPTSSGSGLTPVGLQFDVEQPGGRGASEASVRLRPVVPGAKDGGCGPGCPGGTWSTTTPAGAIPRTWPHWSRSSRRTGRPTRAPATTTAPPRCRSGSRSSGPRCGRPCSGPRTTGCPC
ncbi:SWIM zinc finger family protein [Blastococcus brunescens]|uniref:SWIM zinc finger family protein n=1 Tax=Blastococcus brunescens TaxID=1564165 RepID=A0ABZ1AYR5_9ACTN|nr:SWIM zinc finger family protein [Blastococcus sp. BMG 8361]WRL62239.1 SWIM zinc finger family protein [Blastococcus sp. BMG 8361]